MDFNDITEYIREHILEVANTVNKEFEASKEDIKSKVTREIKDNITLTPIHYTLKNNNCSYDHSGRLVEDGFIDMNQTVFDFLENEYSGRSVATFEKRHGLRYCFYGEDLSEFSLEIGEDILKRSVRTYLENLIGVISDELFFEIMDDCYDEIFDECIAADFFLFEGAVEFVGIGELTLNQIKEM